jgi:uncharacterized protein (DUF885 family)
VKKLLLIGVCVLVFAACGGSGSNNRQPEPPPAGPTPSEQLATSLQGLSLEDFYTTSIEALVRRSPETVIWRSLLDVYPPAVPVLDDLSDSYQRETFAMFGVALDALRTYDRSLLDSAGQLDYDSYEWFLQDEVDRRPFIYHDFVATYNLTAPSGCSRKFIHSTPSRMPWITSRALGWWRQSLRNLRSTWNCSATTALSNRR